MRDRIRAFFSFWYDFIVGDDWRIAIGVAVALVATYLLSSAAVPAWWLLPVAVLLLLPASLWRVIKHTSTVQAVPVEVTEQGAAQPAGDGAAAHTAGETHHRTGS